MNQSESVQEKRFKHRQGKRSKLNLKKSFDPSIKKISDKELESLKKTSDISLKVYKNFKSSLFSKIKHQRKRKESGIEHFETQLSHQTQKFERKLDRHQKIGVIIKRKEDKLRQLRESIEIMKA